MFRRRQKPEPSALTGVSCILSASHRDQRTGKVHGHTWRIRAWFRWNGYKDQSTYRGRLEGVVKPLDHTCLPDEIAWGENLAKHVFERLSDHGWARGSAYDDVVRVQVIRSEEDIWAEYPGDAK